MTSLCVLDPEFRARRLRTGHVVAAVGLGLLMSCEGVSAQNPFDQIRTSSFTYFGLADGAKSGLLRSETIEPGNPQLCVTTTYDYDPYGNKSSATTSNCPGASGDALFAQRASITTYGAETVNVAGVTGLAVPLGLFATSSANALNQSDAKTYDPRFGVPISLTGPNSLTTTWTLDDLGRAVTETRADGTRTFTYYCYLSGRIADTSSNTAGCDTFAIGDAPNDAVAFVHTETHDSSPYPGAKNAAFNRIYSDAAGRTIRTVTEAFDGANQPGGSARLIVQDVDYSPYGPKLVVTQPYFLDSGSSTAAGDSSTTPYGMTLTAYDALGRAIVLNVTDATTATGGAISGNLGGSQRSVAFGVTRGSRQASLTTVAYAGLVSTTTDDRDQTRVQEKNVDGNVVRVADALGAQIAYQHDAFGNLLTTQDALQNQVQVGYDARGRKVSMTDPDSGVWAYCYDALGQLVAQQNSKMRGSDSLAACPGAPNDGGAVANAVGGWATMAYDVLGRVASRVEPEYATAWSYDNCTTGAGKLCAVRSTNGVDKKTFYDGLGRPARSRTTIANGPSFTSAVTYDNSSRPASLTYPTGLKVSYAYTAKGFLANLTLATPAAVTPLPGTPGGDAVAGTTLPQGATLWQADAINAWGRAEQQTYGNQVVSNAAFDASTGRLTNLRAGTAGSSNVVNYGYVWDSINRVAQRTDNNGDGNTGAVGDTFSYDAIGRLTQYIVNAPGMPNLQRTVNVQYNALGMTLYKSDVGDYAYGVQATAGVRPHALQGINGAVPANYGYDANGNLISASAGKYSVISYTSFNLPDSNTGAQGPSGTPKYTWQYDENHQRIKEIEFSSAGSRTTWEIHPDNQGGLAFESETSSGQPTPFNRHYLSVGGVSIGVLVSKGALPDPGAGNAPPVIGDVTLVKVEYWHKDQLGTLLSTTDHFANITRRYAYDPFGKRRQTNGAYDSFGTLIVDWTTNTNSGTDRGYTGHEHLDDLGIIHMNGRIYDPTLGRFMQGDPFIQDPFNLQNYDRYGYCFNSPIGCSDPTGHCFLGCFWQPKVQNRVGRDLWNNPWVRTVVIVVASYYTAGAASSWYAADVGEAAIAGYAGGSSAAGIYGVDEIAAVYAQAYSGAYSSLIGQAIGGGAGGFVGGLAGSNGHLNAGLQGAFNGALTGGISGYFGSSYPVERVVASAAAGGIGSVLRGDGFRSGFESALVISSLVYFNSQMRSEMIEQSLQDPKNDGTGLSGGMNNDRFKLAGGRWYDGANPEKCSPLGCWQNGPGTIFGRSYSSGGFIDMVLESFAGPHDKANSIWWYVNSQEQVLSGLGIIGDALPAPYYSPLTASLLEGSTNYSTSLLFAMPFASAAILEQSRVSSLPPVKRKRP